MPRKKATRGPDKAPRKRRKDHPKPPAGVRGSSPLPQGSVRAIKASKLRIPEGTNPEDERTAVRAFDLIVKVMDGKIGYVEHIPVHDRLRAMTLVREEVCGPIPKEHKVEGGLTLIVETGVPRVPGDDDE